MQEILSQSEITTSLHNLLEYKQKQEKHTILLVDDEENNIQLLTRTLRRDYNILTANNGLDAIKVVEEKGDDISLIISDQRMPKMEGLEFYKHISKDYPDIVKILLTGYTDSEVIVESINTCKLYQYILKPFDVDDLKMTIQNGIKKFELTSNKSMLLKDLKELFYKTLKSISAALDAKDPYTLGHSMRVTLYSLILANQLNLNDETLEEIETAGLLHDIGKIGIPQKILTKPGKLTDEEFEVMKSHPEKGEKMIKNIKKLTIISNWLRTHHERWDGKGYPQGLSGEDIPMSARIIALADTYDAMTSTRSYRQGLPHEVAIQEIKNCAGTQFDPNLAELFISLQDKILEAKEDPDKFYPQYSYIQRFMKS